MKLKTHLCALLLLLSCVNSLTAAGDAAKTLPPLVFQSSFTTEVENFKKSAVTTDLFKRYEFVARGIDGGGDFESAVKRLREYQKEDVAKWTDLATQEFKEPKKPKAPAKSADKEVKKAYDVQLKAYEKRKTAASLRFDNQKAVANAYATWLSAQVLPWIDGLKPNTDPKPAK